MRHKIREIFELTNAARTLQDFVTGMLSQLHVMFANEKELLDAVIVRVNKVIEDETPEMIDGLIRVYEDTYNESEIDAMLAWHKSPTGRKIIAMSQSVQAASMAVGAGTSAKIEEAIKEVVREFEDADDKLLY